MEFSYVAKGYHNKQDAAYRRSWEQTRQIMWAVLMPYQKKGSNTTPEKLLKFPWDTLGGENISSGEASAESLAEVMAAWAAIDGASAPKAIE